MQGSVLNIKGDRTVYNDSSGGGAFQLLEVLSR